MLPKLLWLDVETTGIDLENCYLLEVGAIVTSPDLVVLDVGHWVLQFFTQFEAPVAPEVIEMHTKNGLWKACTKSLFTRAEVDELFQEFISRNFPPDPAAPTLPILAGRNVAQFDRRWLKKSLPGSEAMLHHRCFDMTTVKYLRPWLTIEPEKERPPLLHRSLPDLYNELAELRHLLGKGA
jgi:oligoribonuclease